jgi:hypothetical protein
MKLNELNNSPRAIASKALKESYSQSFNIERLNMPSTRNMLQKVRGLIKESKQSENFYESQTSPAYMKLVFMEQALAFHFNDLRSQPQPRIVVENEEVEKSQVVLAAQDLVDSIQKMLEEVGQMQVKELPALVSSIESEIGANESQTYNDQVSQQLDSLSAALKEAFAGMKSALGTVTGQADAGFEMGAEMGMDAGLEAGDDLEADMDMDMDMDDEAMPEPEEIPEPTAGGGVGRAKR